MQGKSFKLVVVKKTTMQVVLLIFTTVLIANLNAIVDSFLHPEIPYFDHEHLIVGGITGLISGLLFGLLILYTRQLEKALSEIKVLKSFLPICSSCKKIRITDSDENNQESWQSLESYITEHTATRFSHGICPDCKQRLYPEYTHQDENSEGD